MIVALWLKWRESGNLKWVALVAGVLVLDALVGSWLIAQELRLLREAW